MTERRRKVETYEEVYICDSCNKGELQYANIVDPMRLNLYGRRRKYRHVCDFCGAVRNLDDAYPRIIHSTVVAAGAAG